MAPKKDKRKCPRKPRFQEGDRVLCFHGPFLYKAECMKVSVKYRKVKYQVRYFGVKERNALKPGTSNDKDNAIALPAEGSDAGVVFQKRPIPQADWEEEWLPQSKLLKYNQANLRKLRELNRKQSQTATGTVTRSSPREKVPPAPRKNARTSTVRMQNAKNNAKKAPPPVGEAQTTSVKTGRKRGRPPGSKSKGQTSVPRKRKAPPNSAAADSDSDCELNRRFLRNPQSRVRIPEVLKPLLMDDWDLIVKQNQLFRLPARKTAASILEDYEQSEKTTENADEKWLQDVSEVVSGIKAYFNVMLGSQLLYKFERPQYAEILATQPGVSMSHIYGAPHLLRLFVKFEEMLTHTPLEEPSLALLLQHLHSFLAYLEKKFSDLFNFNEYDVAPPEYFRKAF
ncbi:mortality factor 4-like protein 1 [Gracilinanus agilis]|uniref:mortality factor 4-like protein 1 n=1 Tax=Gracilinanus agilis TaxID=191870 RepID=UPI001CFE9813|nr:mortality factor 4-like protein 1 [Gracilinanus agilis]